MAVEDESNDGSGNAVRSPKLASPSLKGLLSTDADGESGELGDGSSTTGRRGIFATSATPNRMSMSPSMSGNTERQGLKNNLNKFLTPSATFARLRDEKEEVSKLTPTPATSSFRDGFTLPLVGEVKPKVLLEFAKTWLRNPKNLALLVWLLGVVVSGAILFMVMVGMLNNVIPSKNDRNTWFEVSNQIINALFTLMCVYLHPQRCHHLNMLKRWSPEDIVKLRKVYCKNGTRKPHEWGHMLVVVLLLQLNCFAQYALCGLNWGYRRSTRPAIGVAICLSLSLGGGAAAGIYNSVSPLGRDFELKDVDSEELLESGHIHDSRLHNHEFAPRTQLYRLLERRKSFATRDQGSVVEKPVWRGGLFDCRSDPAVSVLSTACCVCVFGWNMDRMGFGNRYVHIVTFILICTAPFWIFDLAALNIQNRYVRHSIGGTGIALCAFGLLYGGYWRIRMRERFKLPGNGFCCKKPSVTDCFQWLFLPICSLCQEVRTAEYYDIKDDVFYSHQSSRMPDGSPAPGMASPHTLAPTLSAVQEMPTALQDMNVSGVEMIAHDSPFRDTYNGGPKSPMASPQPVIMDSRSPSKLTPSQSPLGNSTPPSKLTSGQSPLHNLTPPKSPLHHEELPRDSSPLKPEEHDSATSKSVDADSSHHPST